MSKAQGKNPGSTGAVKNPSYKAIAIVPGADFRERLGIEASWSVLTVYAMSVALAVAIGMILSGRVDAAYTGLGAGLTAVMAGLFVWPRQALVAQVRPGWLLLMGGLVGAALVGLGMPERLDGSVYAQLGWMTLGLFFVYACLENLPTERAQIDEKMVLFEHLLWMSATGMVLGFVLESYTGMRAFVSLGITLSLVGLWLEAQRAGHELREAKNCD